MYWHPNSDQMFAKSGRKGRGSRALALNTFLIEMHSELGRALIS